jgi:hypothetical protein
MFQLLALNKVQKHPSWLWHPALQARKYVISTIYPIGLQGALFF